MQIFLDEIEIALNENKYLDAAIQNIKKMITDEENLEKSARYFTEQLAISLQASLLIQNSPAVIADSFCKTRINKDWGYSFGTLPNGVNIDEIISRAWSQ